MKRILYFLLFFLVLLSFTVNSLEEYYADIQIEVHETGLVTIGGNTNFEPFQDVETQMYTSKEGEIWLLNITYNDLFSDYIFRVILPENVIVNYIKTVPNIRFETVESKMNIIGVGESNDFNLIIQYSYSDNYSTSNFQLYYFIGLTLLFIIIILIYFLIFKPKKVSKEILNKYDKEFPEDYSYLPERQFEIIKIIFNNGGSINQKDLENKMSIPKSSLSRNVRALEIKGLIVKLPSGNSNNLRIK